MPFDKDNRLFMVGFLVIASLVVTTALSALYAVTEPIIERQNARLFQVRVLEACGLVDHGAEPDDDEIDRLYARIEEVELDDGRTLYRAYEDDTHQAPLAEALEISGSGLWSEIRLLVALNPNGESIHGLAVVEQGETPGLGGRITEPAFLDKFSGLELGEAPDYVGIVAYETPDAPNEIDAITGATQTSKAVEVIINDGLATFPTTAQE